MIYGVIKTILFVSLYESHEFIYYSKLIKSNLGFTILDLSFFF